MKRLQTTHKRAYTSPVIEVLEAENDMKFLMASATIKDDENFAKRNDFEEDDLENGFKE